MDGLHKESAAITRKRPNSNENSERNPKRQKTEVIQPLDAMETDSQLAVNALADTKINDIPIEILGNNIFYYFDFKYWLKKLIPVCKHWQQAAIRSNVDKQIWLPQLNNKRNILGIHTIMSKYRISTLVIRSTNYSIYNLFGLINASSALSTLVLGNTEFDPVQYTKNIARKYERINTIAIRVIEYQMLRLFPNVKRLTLIGDLEKENRWKTTEFMSDKVKELEITTNYTMKEVPCLKWAKKIFPSLASLYFNQRSAMNSIEEVEKSWKTLEQYGKQLGVAVYCRFPHQHNRFFDLQGISYAHYFNSYAKTPLETLYSFKNIEIQRKFLEKHHAYLTAEYEQSFSQRSRQFVYPILSCEIYWAPRSKYQVSDQMAQLLEEFGLLSDSGKKKRKLHDLLNDDNSEFQSIKELLVQMPEKEFELDQLATWDIHKIVGAATSYQDLVDLFGEERLLKYGDDEDNLACFALQNENYNVWLELVQHGVEIKLGLPFELSFQFFMKAYKSIKDITPKDLSTKFLFYYLPEMTAKDLHVYVKKTKIQLDDIYNETGQSVLTSLIEHEKDCFPALYIILHNCQLDINKPDKNSSTPLISAITQQSISFVDILLEHGADPNTAGDTVLPLSYCLSMSNREFVSQALFSLLLHGADVNKSDYDPKGRLICPLKTVVGCGVAVEMIQVLVSHGARLDFVDNAGNTLLHSVFPNRGDVKNAHVELENTIDQIRFLSKHIDINTRNKLGQTPLHCASLQSDEELEIKTLIECGADVNASEDMMHMTPLLMLLDDTQRHDTSVAINKLTALLLSGKVNIQHKNKANQSFVHYLLQFSTSVIASVFSVPEDDNESTVIVDDTNDNKSQSIIEACKQYATPENISFIKSEIESYLKNNSDKDLHRELSLFTVDISLTKLLIETLGFDVNLTDKHNNSLLLMAQTSFHSNNQVVEYLLSKGAKTTSREIANSKLEASLSSPTKYRMTCEVIKERQAYLKLGADEGSGTIAPLMTALKRSELPPDFIDDVITNLPLVDMIQCRKNNNK